MELKATQPHSTRVESTAKASSDLTLTAESMCLRYTEGYVTHEIPLTKASIEAVVRDVDAVVKVEQRFLNPLRRDDVEFQYSVPVPDLATVISFVLVRQDGSKIVGIVQRKADARVTYDQAVKEGKLAGLAEATTPDGE